MRRLLETMDGQLIMHERNGGYSEGVNLAYAHSRGRYVLAAHSGLSSRATSLTAWEK